MSALARSFLVIVFAALLSSCSVKMAADHRGVGMEDIQRCATRTCFLALRDIEVVSTEINEDGTIAETYRALMKQGSTGRAVMHGLLDVVTLGIWEVAGTPIEGSKQKDNFLILKVRYNAEGQINKVEMH